MVLFLKKNCIFYVVILVVFLTGIWIWSSFRLLAFNCCSSNSALCSYQQWWVKQKKWIELRMIKLNLCCALLFALLLQKYSKCVFYNVTTPFNYMQTLLNQWFCVSLLSIILADLSGNFNRFKRCVDCDWLISIHVFQGWLLVVVIMIDHNRKYMYSPYFGY